MKESTLKYFTANPIYKKNNKKENINFAVFLSGCFLITEVCSNAIRNKLGGLSSKKMYVTKNNLTNGVNF
ncbi:hypothetical protein ACTGWU_09230 [Streptococcus suis]|uniref:hypothetical protein n=1 Tax=Streptococcus parasuis TaxID=1501662 RepID=UPI0028A22BBC|nr:hypothetical protein [Streptococcus parasuis]